MKIINMNRLLQVVFAAIVLLVQGEAMAQVSGVSSDISKVMKEKMEASLASEKALSTEQGLVGDIIEPEQYYLGPGDVLSYINFSEGGVQQFLTVSPEMSLFVPRAGEISVKGMNLSQAKEAVNAKIKQIQKDAMISLSIYRPRRVLFTVEGNYLYNGNYTLPASFRISTALSAIENMAKDGEKQALIAMNLERSADKNRRLQQQLSGSGFGANANFNARNIIIVRNDGKTEHVDIEKSKVTGDVKLNPYLRENDNIILPFPKGDEVYISVSGGVNLPSQIPYKRGDKVSELINMAGGLSENADYDNIQIVCNSNIKTVSFNPNTNTCSSEEIAPGCGIIVGLKEAVAGIQSSKSEFVSVQGEVKKPGIYKLQEGMKLKDVIELAGGFTEDAYLPLASVIRPDKEMSNNKFDDEYVDFFKRSSLTMDDSTRTKMIFQNNLPIVSCNISDLYVNNSEDDNVPLQNGDIIRIPKNPKSVYVSGYVRKPGYVAFVPGKTMDWYIEKAGGLTSEGKKSRARIIRGNSKVWLEGNDKEFVYAGDQIYVPTTPDHPAGSEYQFYNLLISSVWAIMTIVSFVVPLFKKDEKKQ